MDDAIRALRRVVLEEGDQAAAPRLAAALARVTGEPEATLRRILSRTNDRNRIEYPKIRVQAFPPIRKMAAHTVSWDLVRVALRRVLLGQRGDWRAAWEFGPTSLGARWAPDTSKLVGVIRDGTAVLAVRDTRAGLVTVGVGTVDRLKPGNAARLREPWPELRGEKATRADRYLEWARDYEQVGVDRVVFTVEAVDALALREKKRRPKRRHRRSASSGYAAPRERADYSAAFPGATEMPDEVS